MKPLLHALMVFGLASAAVAADSTAIDARVASYHAAGKAVVDMALSKKVDPAAAAAKVDTMVQDASWLATEYGKKHPAGQKLLLAVTSGVADMKKLSFDELEKQWHDLHVFDGKKDEIALDLTDEDNEHFTDPIHALVHPLMVLKAAEDFAKSGSEEALKQIKEEMEEGIEQAEKTAKALKK